MKIPLVCPRSKFRSSGAELFWAPLILQLNCAYEPSNSEESREELCDDDGEKTLDCNDDTTEKFDTKSLETNESTTFNDQEQSMTFYKTENLIPLKELKCFPSLEEVEQLYLNILILFFNLKANISN